ncbi:MAG: hypothetical protein JSW58_01235 [Candidatus Latescibacterota bacterium]|nr:MAG: hypothetical protein JSW58_01235 [Candidatus Latescibacterota bacterium]
MKQLLVMTLVVMLAAAATAFGQEPVEPIDLRADTISYLYPNSSTIQITVQFTAFNTFDHDTVVTSNILLFLGTSVVYDGPMTLTAPTHTCGTDPDCNDDCSVEGDGVTVVMDGCDLWYTWTGPSCNPQNPEVTCTPMVTCACIAQCEFEITTAYAAEHEVSVLLDSNGLVHEADETNNYFATAVGTVPARPSTWGVVKALFDL